MTIECHNVGCKKHSNNDPTDPHAEGPFCYEEVCQFAPLVPAGYTADELDADNPYTQHVRLED